jgi:hypothetical protein
LWTFEFLPELVKILSIKISEKAGGMQLKFPEGNEIISGTLSESKGKVRSNSPYFGPILYQK